MLEMKHTCTDSSQNWTRDFTIDSASNRLLEADVLYSPMITESYTYDNRGNLVDGMSHLGNPLLSPPEYAMTYNELNRLEKVIVNANITCYYQYDSQGQRARKVTYDDSTRTIKMRKYVGTWESYINTFSGETRESLHVMDDQARVALIDTETSASTPTPLIRYQFSNHLGTACLEMDDKANVISYEEYYPFGSTSFQCGPDSDTVSLKRYRYTGKERDEETGLYYHGARYYAPWLARWCAVDPLESTLSPESSYCYGHNNPITWEDSTGMQPEHGHGDQEAPLHNKNNTTGTWETHNYDGSYTGKEANAFALGEVTISDKRSLPHHVNIVDNAKVKSNRDYNFHKNKSVEVIPFEFKEYLLFPNDMPIEIANKDVRPIFWGKDRNNDLLDSWVSGRGPTNLLFLQDHPMTLDMMHAPGVEYARAKFYQKYESSHDNGTFNNSASYTNVDAGFGINGLFGAGSNLTQQFVGNYRIDIYTSKDSKNLLFILSDSKSMTSALYHLPFKNIERDKNSITPGGTTYQNYIWTEPVNFNNNYKEILYNNDPNVLYMLGK